MFGHPSPPLTTSPMDAAGSKNKNGVNAASPAPNNGSVNTSGAGPAVAPISPHTHNNTTNNTLTTRGHGHSHHLSSNNTTAAGGGQHLPSFHASATTLTPLAGVSVASSVPLTDNTIMAYSRTTDPSNTTAATTGSGGGAGGGKPSTATAAALPPPLLHQDTRNMPIPTITTSAASPHSPALGTGGVGALVRGHTPAAPLAFGSGGGGSGGSADVTSVTSNNNNFNNNSLGRVLNNNTGANLPSTTSHSSHNTSRRVTAGGGGGGTIGHTSLDAVTAFDFENDRDCPPAINTNASALQHHMGGGGRGSIPSGLNGASHPLRGGSLTADGGSNRRSTDYSGHNNNNNTHPNANAVPILQTNNFTLPPIAIEDSIFSNHYKTTDSSTNNDPSARLGNYDYNQQQLVPLSARSYTATSKGRRHVTVHAPSDHGAGGGGGNGAAMNANGSMYGTSTQRGTYFGTKGSEGVFGVLVGGIADDNYFGLEGGVAGGDASVHTLNANTSGSQFQTTAPSSLPAAGGGGASFTAPVRSVPLWRRLVAFGLHPMITATLSYLCIAAYAAAVLAVDFGHYAGVRGDGDEVRSGSLWSGVLCACIVLFALSHVTILTVHRAHRAVMDRRAAVAAAQQLKASTTSSMNNSAGTAVAEARHNRAVRISVTVSYAGISVLLTALSVVGGLSDNAHLLAFALPLLGSTTLRPIISNGVVAGQTALAILVALVATILLHDAKGEDVASLGPLWANGTTTGHPVVLMSVAPVTNYYLAYPLPRPDHLWLRFVSFAVMGVIGAYCLVAQALRGDGRSYRLLQEQQAVASILHQLVDLNVESAKECLDQALLVNPNLADGGHAAFSAASRLINGLTLFRSYVPTAVGGLSEDFSSDDESIPDDDDEDLTGGAIFTFGRKSSHSNGPVATNSKSTTATTAGNTTIGGGLAAINMSALHGTTPRNGALNVLNSPKLQPAAPHLSTHPVPAPLEAHFGVKTTFRKRWVTVIHMSINSPSSGLDTTLAEAIGNAVCGPVVDTVTAHRGVVEHMGPMSIVISFNCRVPCVMHETEACRVASIIAEDLTHILPESIKFAVVVASGYCIVGDFGVDTHRAKVIIGDAMDIITRVPPLAIRLGAKVVLTEDTATRVSFDAVPIDNILIGGINAESRLAGGAGITYNLSSGGSGRSVILYELRSVAKNPRGFKSAESTLFASGFSAFRCGEFAAAADRFRRYCASVKEEDVQAKRILELSNWFALNGVAMGPRTYLRREVAWELFEGELGGGAGAFGRGYAQLDTVQPIQPPSPRLNGSTITPSMRSRESSSRDVGEMVRQQIMSNPNLNSNKFEFQEDGGLLGMFIVPDDNDDDVEVNSASSGVGAISGTGLAVVTGVADGVGAGGGLPRVPSPTSGALKLTNSDHEGGGPSSSGKRGASITPTTNTTGSVNYNLSVVNAPSYGAPRNQHFNHSVGSALVPQSSQHHAMHVAPSASHYQQQPFLDPHEEMLLLSAEIPLEFIDSSDNRWKRSETKLGSGAGGAEVYLALGEQGNLVALKCFSLASTKTNQEELIHEVGTLSRLRDDFIVGYVSYAITAHHFIILMEYVSGGSLYQLLDQFGPLPLSTARRFMMDILKGLRYLHDERTTHCDIKPHNALLSTEGSCKLTDFGSCMPASVLEALNQNMPDDMPLVRGTSWYLAPEAARGEVLLANDIWSVGITLIELLTGAHPWQGKPWQGMGEMAFIIKLGKDNTMVPPIPATIEGTARDFILACLQRDPAERPTATELLSHPFIIS